MRKTWLYLKLAVLVLSAVMMFGNRQSSAVEAFACDATCKNTCTLSVCCECEGDTSCNCLIKSGDTGCGKCAKGSEEEVEQ